MQNEVNCMNDSKEFQDAESIRSGNSHVTSWPVSFPPHPIPEGMLRHSFITPSRREGPPSIRDTHGKSGNVFADPDASSSAPYHQELHQWNSSIEEPLNSSMVEKSERQEQKSRSEMPVWTVSQRFSYPQWRETLQRIVEQTNNDCRFWIFILTNSPRQLRSLAGRQGSRLRYVLVRNFIRKRCIGSKKRRWLIQWMI